MNLNNLRNIIKEMHLDGLADLHINDIGRGEGKMSIVQENGAYSVYVSNERGAIAKRGQNLSEEDACKLVIAMLERTRRLAEYYESKGKSEENGFHK